MCRVSIKSKHSNLAAAPRTRRGRRQTGKALIEGDYGRRMFENMGHEAAPLLDRRGHNFG